MEEDLPESGRSPGDAYELIVTQIRPDDEQKLSGQRWKRRGCAFRHVDTTLLLYFATLCVNLSQVV
jgi:hypothetical protein